MSLFNKERVIALITVGVCALLYRGFETTTTRQASFSRQPVEHEIGTVTATPLVESAAPGSGRGDLFTEPRETQPLAPRSLEFPPATARTVAGLPLPIGPDYRQLVRLGLDGSAVEDVTISVDAESTASAQVGDDVGVEPPDDAARRAQADKTYDRLWVHGLREPYHGIVEVDGMNKFDAEQLTSFEGAVVRLQLYSLKEGRFTREIVYDANNRTTVEKIQLADNLRNHLEREARKITSGDFVRRARFIDELLEHARKEAWVYEAYALPQARLLAQESSQSLDGIRQQLRVLRAMGNLAGMYELLEAQTGINRESALRYEELGRLAMVLGLWEDAESHLRHAVDIGTSDARPHAALAEFLLNRSRTDEAVEAARGAERAFGSLATDADKLAVTRIIVAAHLANGDVAAARRARQRISAMTPAYLDGCIAYADGDASAALIAFRRAKGNVTGGSVDAGAAVLGEAAALLQLGNWQESHDVLRTVHDDYPLLRHRAAAGLSLLFQRLGQLESGLSWAERALEADPGYAYAHYLRGRALRLSGSHQAAEEALRAALRLHDDFVHAITELATLYAERAETALGDEAVQLADSARRYADRAVELAPVALPELFELQGRQRFAIADRRGAADSFGNLRDIASTETDVLFARGALAVVDYSRGRVDDARAVLLRMMSDLAKENPAQIWADATVTAIDDHAQKELLTDSFDRDKPGQIWPVERDGQLMAKIVDGRLVFDGTFGSGEVYVSRASAVQKGKNFLAVGVTMQIASGHDQSGFCGLRVVAQRGAGGRLDSRIELGLRDGVPTLTVLDNREASRPIHPTVIDFDVNAPQDLGLRVVPSGENRGRKVVLQVSWNDQIIHVQDLQSLATETELDTVLFAQGTRGSSVDVAFDNYRLERKKE